VKKVIKDKKRLVKLKEILAILESGKDVPNRALKVWMDGDFDCIANEWENYKSMQEYYADKPCEVEQYEDYFRKGMFDYNKAEGYSRKGNKTAEKFYNSSENKFETALEYLQGIVDKDPSLHGWFDRDVGWSEDNNIAPYPVSMPRVITSRSLDNLSATSGFKKINVKINCVKGVIENLLNPTPNISIEEQAKQLKKMLKRIKNKR